MARLKRIGAGLLACVMLLSAVPMTAMATETEECPHQYESAITEPTCTQGGYTSYKCSLCEEEYVADEVDPTGICTLEAVPEEEASCTETGVAAHYKCANCGKRYLDEAGTQPVEDAAQLELPRAKCTLEAVPEEEASCTQTGVAAHYKCVDCGKQYLDEAGTQPVEDAAQLELPKAKCALEAVPEEEASCTQTGVAAHYKCANCGKQYLDEAGTQPVEDAAQLEIPVKEHAFGPWQTVTVSTPEQPGVEQRQCQNCEATEERNIDALSVGLPTPSLQIKVNSTSGKPYLSWKTVKNATAYRIYLVDPATEEKTFLKETTSLNYTYQEAEPGNTYTFTIAAVNATKCSKYSSVKSVLCKCAKPAITITSDPASGKPVVQWKAVDGAVSYELFRSTDNKKFKSVAKTAELSVQVDSSAAGKTYYYRLRAIGPVEGSNSGYSTTVKHLCDCARPEVSVTSGASVGIKVSWGKISGAKKYEVYRASKENGEYTRIATTSSLSYTDTKAPKHQISFYQVRAYGSSTSSRGAFSAAVSLMNHAFGSWKIVIPSTAQAQGKRERICSVCGHTEEETTPVLKQTLSTPKLRISSVAETGKPSLSWDAVKNASRYQIWLVNTVTGEKTLLAEVAGKKFVHTDAEVGVTYTYQLMAVSDTRCSKFSAQKSIVHKCPRPTIQIGSESASGKPIVQWKAVDGAASYILYRSTSSNKNFKKVAQTTELSVQDDSAAANKTYYYRLQAVGSAAGSNSAYSATVKYVCDCAQPVVTTASGASGGIKVSWGKVSGAKYYNVYRASSADGVYTKIKKTTSLSYTDTKAPRNQMSYYKVKAFGSSASMSAYSEVASAMNHTFGGWVTVVPSTPDSEGIQERTCTACGHVESKTVPVLKRSLSTPTLTVTSENASGKPTLSWKSVSKATAYWVYLREGDTDTFLGSTTSRSYVHKGAVPGKTYNYTVVAVNNTSCSAYSEAKAAVCRCAAPQPAIHTNPDSECQALSWNMVEGASVYRVYRSVVKNASHQLVATVEDGYWSIEDETPGVQYYYYVQAIHGSCEDADSVLSAVCFDGSAGENFVIYAGQISATCNKVAWKAVTGATKYEVYRSAKEDSSFVKVATEKDLEYLDLSVKAGTTYFYWVKAVGTDIAVSSPVQAADAPSQVPVRVYISPSCQTENWYAYGSTTEAIQCRAIAKLTVQALERCGIAALTNVTDDMDERMAESNAWGADLHVPIHSNAYNRSAMGTQIYHDGKSGGVSKKACNAIFKVLAPLSPGSSGESTRANAGLYEIRKSNAPTAYIEVAFHDTVTEAKWIINNKAKIAEAICKGICNLSGIPYVAR